MAAASSLYPRADVVHRACARDASGFGPTHANGWYELTWLESGTAAFRIGQRQLVLRPGECLLLPPDVENTPWVQGVSVHQTWLAPELIGHAYDELGRARRLLRDPLVLSPDAAVSALSRALFVRARAGCLSAEPGQAATLDAIAFALAAPDAAAHTEGGRSPQLQAALELIAHRYAEPLGVDDLARAAGMNRFTFMRAFRAALGQSPYQYLLGYRLERAAEALRGRVHASVLDVALTCGLDDPGRFARMFRARFGCSPRMYRRQEWR
jgi:AraC family transcriptional regulator